MINLAQDVIDGKYTKEQIADPERSGSPPQIYGGVADEFGLQARRDFINRSLTILDNEAGEFRYRLAERRRVQSRGDGLGGSLTLWMG